jgi:hypothetical protein
VVRAGVTDLGRALGDRHRREPLSKALAGSPDSIGRELATTGTWAPPTDARARHVAAEAHDPPAVDRRVDVLGRA